MNLLRKYIRILLKEQPDLGNVVFGEDEEDTGYEAKLHQFFSDLFNGDDDPATTATTTTAATITIITDVDYDDYH